ncbi:MAG: TIGR00304 family protein [Thermoprotei archaeon]|nr:MAG: TIGR00304 family protein [Thermoprotei archaeon]RLE89198.1 MAG: TIGR00304 family protein [Thermoprotei archaeon]
MSLELDGFKYLFIGGFILIVAGILLVTIGSILPITELRTSGAVVVFIGPIPLIFGWGAYSWILILISILIVIVMILIIYLMFKRFYYGGRGEV